MTRITRINPIYTAIARPGAGKTEALLNQLPLFFDAGKRIVLTLPTLALINDVEKRASKAGIHSYVIDHQAGESVIQKLELALQEKRESFIICTQEALRRVKAIRLQGWILVIDELPTVVAYPDYALKPAELSRVLDYVEENEGRLWIKDECAASVRDQIDTNRADSMGVACSTLGASAANIFRLLLADIRVSIDEPQANGVRHVRAVEEFQDWWEILGYASETHVLAANLAGSEFELFAIVHGFTFKKSELTPEQSEYTSPVRIYPIMPKGRIFSKQAMQTAHGDKRLIDVVLSMTLERTRSKPLLLANKWAGFQHLSQVQYVRKDCRGLNDFDAATEIILLFGGNPSPSDLKGLEHLQEKYGTSFMEAFITTRLLEPSLQAVTRTAIRRSDNTNPIHLYVQDERVAQYLLDTYFPNAVIDWSLSEEIPVKPDGRKREHPQYAEVLQQLSDGVPIKVIARNHKVTAKTIRRWREALIAA